jgi:hypothetical protein
MAKGLTTMLPFLPEAEVFFSNSFQVDSGATSKSCVLHFDKQTPNVTYFLRIWEVLGSDLGPKTSYRG